MRVSLLLAAAPLALAVSPALAQETPADPPAGGAQVADTLEDFEQRGRTVSRFVPAGCNAMFERNDSGRITAVLLACPDPGRFATVQLNVSRLASSVERDYFERGQSVLKITRRSASG